MAAEKGDLIGYEKIKQTDSFSSILWHLISMISRKKVSNIAY